MWFSILLLLAQSHKQIRVAVIDTGLDLADRRFSQHLCPSGHKDLTGMGIKDTNTHGTHVTGLIVHNALDAPYCLLIYKYYDDATQHLGASTMIGSIREAIKNKANIVNISAGGNNFVSDEYDLIKNHPDVLFIVAAGNDGRSLDGKDYHYYPASYNLPNMLVVGNITKEGDVASNSNYGSFVHWIVGTDVVSTLPGGKIGTKSGTSMSTAIFTGKMLYFLSTF